ncbi:MAG TPA: TonB-dependent receptor [Pseudomonadales bacterium]
MKLVELRSSVLPALAVIAGMATVPIIPAAQAATAQDRSGVIEEVVVTSRRRAESQQDVPLAVTAFNADDLEQINPDTLRDIDGRMPNVFIGRQTAGPQMGAIYIRGLGYADVEKNIPPAVGVIVDEIYQGTNTGQLIDMFDVEQIEVNRGPQGVLFGKNTTGGTIVVKRVQPRFNDWGFSIAGELGNYDKRDLKGRINIPLIDDKLAVKIGGIMKERDGYWDNITTDSSNGDIDYQAYTGAVKWAVTDDLTATLTYDHIRDRSDSVAMDARYNGDDPFVNENDWDAQTKYNQDMVGLVMDWQIGGMTLSSITGWVDEDDWVQQDFDSATLTSFDDSVSPVVAPQPLAQLHTLRDQTYEQFSQEIRLTGDFSEDWHFTVGGFYWDAEIGLQQTTNAIAQLANPTGLDCATFGTAVVPGFLFPHQVLGDDYCTTPYIPTPGGPLGDWTTLGISVQNFAEDVQSWAVFGSVDWEVTDRIELSAGLRYIDEEKKMSNDFVALAPPPPPGFPVSIKDSWDDVIFKFTANWAATDTSRLYFSYADGFRSGGFASRGNRIGQLTYEPEDVTTYEVGSKNDYLDGKLRLNFTAFLTDMKDQQYGVVIQDPFAAPGTNTVVNNANKTKIYGIEADMTAMLGEYFTVIGQVGFQEAERKSYDEDCTRVPIGPLGTAGIPGSAACPGTTVELPSQQLPRAPDWNWSLTGVFDHQFGATRVVASATVRRQDDFVISSNLLTGQSDVGQGRYTLVDARLALEWMMRGGDRLTVAVYGRNLGDKEYKDYELPLGATGGFQGWGPPRHYALELRWDR